MTHAFAAALMFACTLGCFASHAQASGEPLATCSPIAKVHKCRVYTCRVTLANGHVMRVPRRGAVRGRHGCYNLPGRPRQARLTALPKRV